MSSIGSEGSCKISLFVKKSVGGRVGSRWGFCGWKKGASRLGKDMLKTKSTILMVTFKLE